MRTVKTTAKHLVGAIGRMPGVSHLVQHPRVRDALEKKPAVRMLVNALYGVGWERIHPFDRLHGTDTSGVVPADALPEESSARAHAICYAGSQPNVLRLALAALAPLDGFSFLDPGCGKGRALIVSLRVTFLNDTRRRTVAAALGDRAAQCPIVARRHPHRVPLTVAGHCFDASPLLRRRFAAMLPYAAEERGFAPDLGDPLVIWQGGAAPRAASASANATILSAPGCNRVLLESAARTL